VLADKLRVAPKLTGLLEDADGAFGPVDILTKVAAQPKELLLDTIVTL
jgi:hypothetical protein